MFSILTYLLFIVQFVYKYVFMKKYALFTYVRRTKLPYSDRATIGVEGVAQDIRAVVEPVFDGNIRDLGAYPTKDAVSRELTDIADKLDNDGLCFFYFHGHGASIPGAAINDEDQDQALVCYDQYLRDDDLSEVLRLFKPTQRFFSVVDSCSSRTVVEWSFGNRDLYPEIIHYSSSPDGAEAYALPQGGLFSQRFFELIYGGAYESYTYQSLADDLERYSVTSEFKLTTNLHNLKLLDNELFT